MTTTCIQCPAMFDYEPIAGLSFELKPTVCRACEARQREADRAAELKARFDRYHQLCPPLYANTDPEHPDMPPIYTQLKVLNWKAGPQGLLILGDTRKGKTRLMWLLLKRLILEGKNVLAMTSSEFARDCAEAYGHCSDGGLEWFDNLAMADILFIDDLGKFKLTERVECELFDLIEYRTSRALPLLFTSNSSGNMLLERMSADRGPATIGRIREFCTVHSL